MDERQELDAQAVRRCQAGDCEAFGEIVARHQDRVYGLCLRLCMGAAADAADLAQETFVRAYDALGRFDAGRPLLPWLLRIAVNLARDRARRRQTRPEMSEDEALEQWPDPADGPEDVLIREDERRAVRAAVAALPEDQRVLIALAYDEDLPLAEVARITGLPLTIVKNRLFRARRALGTRLRKEDAPDGLPARPEPAGRVRLR